MQCQIVRKFGRRWQLTRPRFERSCITISWEENVFRGPMEALSNHCILWLLWGGRQMISTWFSRAKVMTPGSLCVKSASQYMSLNQWVWISLVLFRLIKWLSKCPQSMHRDVHHHLNQINMIIKINVTWFWQFLLKPFFHEKEFLTKPSASKAGELLSLNRNQLRIMTGLLTGHCHLKGHLFKLALVNSPECDRWKQVTEMASHVLCYLGALAAKRFRHLGETRWLWRHFYQQDTALCSWYRAVGCMIIRAAQSITNGWSAHHH